MLLFANKASGTSTGGTITGSTAVGATITLGAGEGAEFVGVGGVATSAANPMRVVLTAVDANGNDTGSYEIVEVTRSVDTLTTTARGLEGTTAATWAAGTRVECRATAGGASGFSRVLYTVGETTHASSAVEASHHSFTIPANTLKVGDFIRVTTNWRSVGTTSAKRGMVKFGATYINPIANLTVSETFARQISEIHVLSATSQAGYGVTFRTAAAVQNAAASEPAEDIATDILIDWRYLITSPDTLQIAGATVELIRGNP